MRQGKTIVSLAELKRLVTEQLAEDETAQLGSTVTAATALIGALQKFEQKAPDALKSSLSASLQTLRKALDDVISNPRGYLAKPGPQRVKLQAVPVE